MWCLIVRGERMRPLSISVVMAMDGGAGGGIGC